MENIEIMLVGLLILCVILSFLLLRLRTILGKTFDSAIGVMLGRIKNPGTFFTFLDHRFAGVEFRDTQKTQHLIESDNASPVITLEKKTVYRTYLNYPTYVLYQGQPTSVDPLKYVVGFAEFERLGLLFNKALEAEEQRVAMRYKTQVVEKLDKIYKLLWIALVGIALIAFLVYGVTQFVDTAKKTFEQYKPVIDEAAKQFPRITPTNAPPGSSNGDVIEQVNKIAAGG
jgi:hypothetical protein